MNKLVNHEVEVGWFGDSTLVTVNSALKPYNVMGKEIHIVTVDYPDKPLSKDFVPGSDAVLRSIAGSDYKYLYAFYYDGRLITFFELAEVITCLSEEDSYAIHNEFKTVCADAMLSPVYIEQVDGRTSVIAFVTDTSKFDSELNNNASPYAAGMIKSLKEHAHVAQFTIGLFNTMFNRFNIDHMPKAENIAYAIMNGEYITENGELQTMSIKDVEVLIEDIKSHIRIGAPSARG